jgi:hypothetical protein
VDIQVGEVVDGAGIRGKVGLEDGELGGHSVGVLLERRKAGWKVEMTVHGTGRSGGAHGEQLLRRASERVQPSRAFTASPPSKTR